MKQPEQTTKLFSGGTLNALPPRRAAFRNSLSPVHGERINALPPRRAAFRERIRVRGRVLAGFTLLELLVATLVAAIVLAAINTAFYAALRLRSHTSDAVDKVLPVNRSLGILKADLRNTLLTGGALAGSIESPGLPSGISQPSDLDIYTTSGALNDDLPWGDIQKVSYYLKDSTGSSRLNGQDLIRAVTRNLLATTQPDITEQVLLSGVGSLQFSFWDGTSWLTAWDSTTALTPVPQAIKAAIEFVKEDAGGPVRLPIELVVPIDAQSTNNPTLN
jgi:type II secretion system protein J